MYLLTLLGFLSVGAFLVVRQVLIRRELDEAAKGLGERIRTGEASCEVSLAAACHRKGSSTTWSISQSGLMSPNVASFINGLQDYFELGVVLTRKKLYTQATKNLEKAKKLWDGEESELAQVSTPGT
jgi:hypothetical protein